MKLAKIEQHKLNGNYALNWTTDAKYCYSRGCICKDCAIAEIFPKCEMKYAVKK